ncbi:MAG: ECF transporter S component [Ruminococcus sp.]|nr:ECF transporter S component [Ruminococcus sp.]
MKAIKNKKLRKLLSVIIPFVMIPLLVTLGAMIFEGSRYIIISSGIAVLTLVYFITGFERRQTGSRRMVITSVMTALCVAGRFIPFIKPVTAVTIISGIYLGKESGFFVGAISVLLSNFYFGQGPWTPFQMLGMGIIGLLSGVIDKPLKENVYILAVYGVLTGLLYSLIMDIWTVLWYRGAFDLYLYGGAVLTSLPHTISYAVGNVVFLWILGRPFGTKLERIKRKYGI